MKRKDTDNKEATLIYILPRWLIVVIWSMKIRCLWWKAVSSVRWVLFVDVLDETSWLNTPLPRQGGFRNYFIVFHCKTSTLMVSNQIYLMHELIRTLCCPRVRYIVVVFRQFNFELALWSIVMRSFPLSDILPLMI